MEQINSLKSGDTLVLVGTMKGAWLFKSDKSRKNFQVSGPHFPGREIYSINYDPRNGRILAGASSFHWGAVVAHSDDLGANWQEPAETNVRFPEGQDWSLARVWQLHPAGTDQQGLVYAGVEPASLFRSTDSGETFELVEGLFNHPHRTQWMPGGGGLCLHTIVIDPENSDRIYVAISTGGVYRSDDGGKTWNPKNNGVRAEFMPDKHPEFGQCVHKITMNPQKPQTFFLQNHFGLYRSDDGAESWTDIANGVPSDFGFPIAVHPHDPSTAYIVPLEADRFRVTPEGKCRVYRTRNSGESWEPLTRGLPQENAYVTVVRDALDTDSQDPAGVYFGTRQGELYGSADEGESWTTLAERLPPIVCVKAIVAA